MKKENKVGFALQGIKTEQFAVIKENYNANKKDVGLSTSIEFNLNEDEQSISVFLGFEFSQAKKVFIKIIVSCHFKIDEQSWKGFLDAKHSKMVISKGFLSHLAMLSVGTTRGVLFAKTEGTPFSSFMIPTLNVSEIIKEDASFEIKSK